ncbi:HPP family protein [Pyxidicoccus sp. MSG2]|uniref:CBS domain-containing protein n=1 Tax=Pyxidicoccus sp. MSG2 TaxID=2996790 RepID=UPI002270A3D5|nr:CBS domain-containing protein [Pyxidicoccus sp. MSG2]MCY1022542.1 CBS domain-containing protein [Pyxidicoccus sp. MSG2]
MKQAASWASMPPEELLRRMLAPLTEVMSHPVVCVGPDDPAEVALRLLVEHGISGLPVVDAQRRPIGMLSRADLLEERLEALTEGEFGPRPRVCDLMTQQAMSLPETALVREAAALMSSYGVHRVPVRSPAGELVGIVSTLDVLRWLAAPEGLSTVR